LKFLKTNFIDFKILDASYNIRLLKIVLKSEISSLSIVLQSKM